MRLEVRVFMRACDNLSGCAHQNNGALTNEECETVVACIRALEKSVLPPQTYDQPLASPLGVLPPPID